MNPLLKIDSAKRSTSRSTQFSLYKPLSPIYKRSKNENQKISRFLKEKAIESKRDFESKYERITEVSHIIIPQEKYINEVRRHCDKVVIPPLIKSWEDKILQLVPKNLRDKFPKQSSEILSECKEEWISNLHDLTVKTLVREVPGEERIPYVEKAFQFGGKTDNYEQFVLLRKLIEKKLLITHPLIRRIFDHSVKNLPAYLVRFDRYKSFGYMNLKTMSETFSIDMNETINSIVNTWYPHLLSYCRKSKSIHSLPRKKLTNLLRCASKMVGMQLVQLMIRSIECVVKVIDDSDSMPLINISVKLANGEIVLYPTFEDIQTVYCHFIRSITSTFKALPSFESVHDETKHNDIIDICFNDIVYDEFIELLKVRLEKRFNEIKTYISALKDEYHELLSSHIESSHFLTSFDENEFMSAYDKILSYRTVRNKLSLTVNSEYFTGAMLSLSEVIQGLTKSSLHMENAILSHLCLLHKQESRSICEQFENIADKVIAVPKDAAELISTGQYCTHAKTVLIENLKERIAKSIAILSQLIDITSLSGDHVALNTKMINWINEIAPVLERSGSNYETIKYDMEEALLVKTNSLMKKVMDIFPYLKILDYMDDINNTLSYLEDLRRLVQRIDECEKDLESINTEESTFKFPLSQYTELDELKNYVFPFYELMYLLHKWRRNYFCWMDGPFEKIKGSEVERQHESFTKEFNKIFKDYKNEIKQQIADNKDRRFKGLVEDPDPMNLPAPMKLCSQAMQELKEFKPCVQLVNIMCNPALNQRHWDEMSKISGFDLTPDAGTTIRKINGYDLWKDLKKYEIISMGACKELALIENLDVMITEWKDVNFEFTTAKDSDLIILTKLDIIQTLVDDHLMKTVIMRGSPFVKPFEEKVKDWYDKLTRINSSIEEWGKVQHKWLYFLPLMSSKDIVDQMPSEGVMFQNVDLVYKKYINIALKTPSALKLASGFELLAEMKNANNLLEKVSDGVNNYIEKKRLFFPRFFFLSTDEILEILSETSNPTKVRPHLKKCFEGINDLNFDSDYNITAMISKEGERVQFLCPISTQAAKGSVEKWLAEVEKEMLKVVRARINLSFVDFNNVTREKWLGSWEGMVILCVSQIYWAISVHDCFDGSAQKKLEIFFKSSIEKLNELVRLIRSPSLTNAMRVSIKALIVIDVHAKDIIQELIERNVCQDTDFNWLSQLRYYLEENEVNVKIINTSIKFAYEYLGNTDRLVVTPLTDRCYRTLIGAFSLHLNGAPEGPAGTGKTETTKDLAKALAKQCIVFNCSEGLDYKSMGRFFKGLASTGAWACFDEFNRIDAEVLSVVAQQISVIVQAVRQNVTVLNFEGTMLNLNPTCYVCITMNPGYAGRSQLPDNLKVLFRTVAMMVPNYAMIGEISLYSFGFLDARNLAVKIVMAYRLLSEQLSFQHHYDYGMRAVKAVLLACGKNKIKFPDENEEMLLLLSLRDVNLSKFLNCDIPLFEAIISDVFPGVEISSTVKQEFIETVHAVAKEMNLVITDGFFEKINQTRQMLNVRHGFMLIGDPLSGKSSVLKVLYETLCIENGLGSANECRIVNPKSIHLDALYGCFDKITQEWHDGIAGQIFRDFSNTEDSGFKWIIFDGPVDAIWIENMNTVLDDSKMLCLMSGEVIRMSENISVIFETMDLSQASPATVSRCGMIYMESLILSYAPLVKSWVVGDESSWKTNFDEFLIGMCDWLFPPVMSFLKSLDRPNLTGGHLNLVMATLRLINMLMEDAISVEEDSRYLKTWIQASFVFGIVWGFGGNLNSSSKAKFDIFFRDLLKNEESIPEIVEKLDVSLPPDGLLNDYIYQYKQKGGWKPWQEILKTSKITEAKNTVDILVPTVDTLKYMHLIEMHIKYDCPFAFIGPTGTGKTFYMKDHLVNKLSIDKFTPISFNFTTTISAKDLQEWILSKLCKLKKMKYGPGKGKRGILFIDNVNMPAKEIYGAQPPIELLRQLMDYNYIFDLKSLDKIFISDLMMTISMGLVGGNRQLICPRFLRHFGLYYLDELSNDTMYRIFSNTLQIGLRRNGFGNEITPFITSAINGSLNMYTSIKSSLLPTVENPHYIFNLRDICRVIQGCALIKKDSLKDDSKKVLIKLWIHEMLRVFSDRLTSTNDRDWFFSAIKANVEDVFKEKLSIVCDSYLDNDGNVSEESLRTMMFGSYFGGDGTEDEKSYVEVTNYESFLAHATSTLSDYNDNNKRKIDIVLFRYALEHLSKICRIFTIPGGNALLVGVSGSGKQSLTRLASAMMGCTFFQPEITKDYDLTKWRDDLKRVLKLSGSQGKDVVFLLNDTQIIDETFIQNIDTFLNSGEVPKLFDFDEQQEILELVRLTAQGGNRNLDISPIQVMSYFIATCKAKLHVCICLSPIANTFRERIRLYPTLVDCCTIDWFDPWPEEALEKIGENYFETTNFDETFRKKSIDLCKYFHTYMQNVSKEYYENYKRNVYITSGGYIDLIKLFILLMNKRQEELSLAKERYVNGLEKLNMAAEAVAQMQKDLNELKPQLIEMAEKGNEMMDEIEKETIEADKATVQVKEDEKIANEQAAASQELKNDCEADLALAIPILEDAIAALNTLKPTDITLVKSMKNPPGQVKLVMAAVCVMKSIPPDRVPDPNNPGRKMLDFWGPSKRVLGDMAFLQNLKDYDKDNIPPVIMAKIRKDYLPNKDFNLDLVAKASTAAQGLCKWVIAMEKYDTVAKAVAPKKTKLQAAESEFAATMAVLEEKKAMVARLEKKVADLNAALEEANLKKRQLEDEVELCINKLFRAEKLLKGLGGEKSRWTKAAENLQNLYDNLAGDILLSCGFIAYLAPFPAQIRSTSLSDWQQNIIKQNFPLSEHYLFSSVLGNDIQIQEWYISNLPRDQISTDNAIIQDISFRWSLFIDPQEQAKKWIKSMEQKNALNVIKLTDPDFMKIMQSSMTAGSPVMIENIFDELPALLDPILMKNTYSMNDKQYISLGENDVEYNKNFRLYLMTKLRNPKYNPEVYNKLTVIDFALSVDGLEDQLLGIVVAKERPDLQEKRELLIIERAQNAAELKNVEKNILKTLQESKGDILEDEEAIEILDSSKKLANDILNKNKAAEETEQTIEEFRKSYMSTAKFSANLYYCITDLPSINIMYQFSLVWFINLYTFSIRAAKKSNSLKKRLQYLNDKFIRELYSNVCGSLFAKDKLTFSFVLCCKTLMLKNEIHEEALQFLISKVSSIGTSVENPVTWLPSKSWNEICKISDSLPKFQSLKSSFVGQQEYWKTVYDSFQPQNETFPDPWQKSLSIFERLLIIKFLRPDKILDSITDFIAKSLGKRFVTPPPFDLMKSFKESNCLLPLMFVLSSGTDPISSLIKFSERTGDDKKLSVLSLGQDQGPIAESLIKQAQLDGNWVCLQNCHLALSWLPKLENIIESLNLTNTKVNFRLWLTAYPSEKIPQSILLSSIKITNEPPMGLKNNITRSYNSDLVKDRAFYDGCPDKYMVFTKLLYSISFFHAVIQERKKFGALGWNIPYSFDDSDFKISIMQLQVFLNQYEDVPFVALSYLIGECNYGGRVTDDWDRRLMMTILREFMNSDIATDPDYCFYEDNFKYNLPTRFEHLDYLNHIELLPENPSPEVFGLNLNAGMFCDYNNSLELLESLSTLHEQNVTGNSADDCDTLCQQILEKLPEEFKLEAAREKYPFDYEESLNIFLVQEMERYNNLRNVIANSLSNIQKGLKGVIVITPGLEVEANYIRSGKVPETWHKHSYPSLKLLGSYVSDLIERLNMIGGWYEDGQPSKFWMSGFFFTQAFLTGGMQNYARRNKIPIDLLTFDCEVTNADRCEKSNSDGLHVYGLFIDGARWNSEKSLLDEQRHKVLNEEMPVIRLYPILKVDLDENDRYTSPIYKTLERKGIISTTGHSSNFVMSVMIPSDRPSQHWIKRSVALMLQLND